VGLYTLPLIIWHPLQLLIGSSLVPRLSAFVESETERLAALEGNGNDDDNSGDLERAQKEVGGGLADDERS
jgi:sodium/bile acid cotransporter 7